jgi:DNA-binding response OmpR family regulator
MSPLGKVLIIDDEKSLRQTLARILQQADIEATTVENGEQGLAYIEAGRFDLVYLDIRLPDLTGLEVLDIIRVRHPGLPVVLFTAQPDLNSAVEALRRGAADYLLKPLKPEAIIDKTKKILLTQHKERRKREILMQIEALQNELKKLESEDEPTASAPEPISNLIATERYIKRGNLVLDFHTRRLMIGERVVNLPPTSFDFLAVLVRHAPNVVDYQTLVAEAQGYKTEPREAQELTKWHIHHIRQAIEQDVRNPTYLFNVRGIGYRLVAD